MRVELGFGIADADDAVDEAEGAGCSEVAVAVAAADGGGIVVAVVVARLLL